MKLLVVASLKICLQIDISTLHTFVYLQNICVIPSGIGYWEYVFSFVGSHPEFNISQ